jgi:F0F1-type ATP synthase membrane subunit b/b'
MEILPDPVHAALLTVPFLVAVAALYFILWQPLLAYLDERDEVSARARHEAKELASAAAEQVGKIEARLAEARQKVVGLRQEARNRALSKENEIVASARTAADHRVAEALAEIGRDKSVAAGALRHTANELSDQIAARVLGRSVRS